jgi:hypothetical protein
LHTYDKARKVITRTKTTLDVTTPGDNRSNVNVSHSGPSSSINTDKQETDEKVRCIPVEDIISVSYSTDVKKEYEIFETTQERARAQKGKLGCCAQTKNCLRQTFCCCPKCPCKICKPPPKEIPQYDTNRRQNMTANRMVVIEMKCIRYTNIHIPSYVQVLPNDEKINFYKKYFDVDTIEFYLVNNTETDENQFKAKCHEAEEFSRTIVQLRNMVIDFFFKLI